MNTVETVLGKADTPTIEIAAHAGTCYGVRRALDMALAAAPQVGETAQVHTLGPWCASLPRQASVWPTPWTMPHRAP